MRVAEKLAVAFIGLIASLKNVMFLFNRYKQLIIVVYLPMYKLSQDYLEIIFSAVRSWLGYKK